MGCGPALQWRQVPGPSSVDNRQPRQAQRRRGRGNPGEQGNGGLPAPLQGAGEPTLEGDCSVGPPTLQRLLAGRVYPPSVRVEALSTAGRQAQQAKEEP